LGQQVERREQSERVLRDVQGRLEAEVAHRTRELAQRNAQLRVELQERVQTETALERRLRFEEGLASCSQILQTEPDPHLALKRCLAQLRESVGSTRAFLYLNVPGEAVAELAALTCAGGVAPVPRVAPRRWRHDAIPGSWLHRLYRGEPVILDQGVALPGWGDGGENTVRLFVAIGWEGGWRGLLGFERTGPGAAWSREETRLLRTASEMLGAYRERRCAEEALRRAHMELEQRVAARTADLSATNERLERAISERVRAEEEKQRLERQLHQMQKMKAIGTLAGGIAHDFNNILSSILGFTELALHKLPDDLPQRRYLDEVYKAGNRAKELVRQILVFSRQSSEERTPVDLNAIVSEAVALLEASLPDHVTLRTRLDEQVCAVLADPVQMHQVLMNLCHNAIHAMEENGGTLEVRLRGEQFEAPIRSPQGEIAPGSYAVITVSDTGHGMPASVVERIFEPFFTTKKVGEGTGMGLAIVHGIVSSLDGAIFVETVPGAGTSFHLYLPRHRRVHELEPGGTIRTPDSRGQGHILVVDDEIQLVAMWAEMLESYGYEVARFTRSRDALDAFEQDPYQFDLALIDQTMPGLTGAEMARAMLAQRPDFPIIMATGFSEAITAEDARAIGIREFVLKPIIANELIATIQDILRTVAPPA
jgi:signal transduction histidine kinase/ActR/RegA family two-component response regulator